jgi:DNA-binding FrmR family transcriptional regulator
MPNEAAPKRVKADTAEKRGPHPVNTRALRRLGIIEGQIRGIGRMIEEEKYCMDILTQISAARAALSGVGTLILRRHIEQCFSKAVCEDGVQSAGMIDELMEVFSKQDL